MYDSAQLTWGAQVDKPLVFGLEPSAWMPVSPKSCTVWLAKMIALGDPELCPEGYQTRIVKLADVTHIENV